MKKDNEFIGRHSKYLAIGSAIISRFMVPINFILLLIANFKLYQISIDVFSITMFILVSLAIATYVGYKYDKLGLLRYEYKFESMRHPIYEDTQYIRKKLDRKVK